jgi:integrase/recombinase XerD
MASRNDVTGPLAPFVEVYAAELRDRGYTTTSVVNDLQQMERLSGWLQARGLRVLDLDSERVDQFLAWQRAGGRHRASWSRAGLVCLQEVLRGLGVLVFEDVAPPGSVSGVLLARFERYLLSERGLATASAMRYAVYARRFLDGLPGDGALADLTAREVRAAVAREAVSGSVSVAQCFVTALRAFLRFCFIEGLVEVDLSPVVLSVQRHRGSLLPKGISRADAEALLATCDRRQGIGRRDYALLVTLLRLGLRASEASALTLDDIDWRAGELVVHGKGACLDRLPLPADVGEAFASYLRRRDRPRGGRRELFLSARAPFRPLSPHMVSNVVRLACRRAGVTVVGAHRLRHTLACEMVGAQVPLEQISQVLRHRQLETTANYARVNVERLRALAMPWPGGAE